MSSLLTQQQNYGLSHFVLLQKIPHIRNQIDISIFSPFQQLLLGIGGYQMQTEQELLSFGRVFPNDPSITSEQASSLEEFFQHDKNWWPLAARLHAEKSEKREMMCRMELSVQQIPFVLPNSLHPMQIHAIAAGHRILHVFHVDWLRKLSSLILDVLEMDVECEGLWLYDILSCLDEKVARKKVDSFLKKQKRMKYGKKKMAVAVLYGYQLGLDISEYEQNLSEREKLLLLLGKECTKKIME